MEWIVINFNAFGALFFQVFLLFYMWFGFFLLLGNIYFPVGNDNNAELCLFPLNFFFVQEKKTSSEWGGNWDSHIGACGSLPVDKEERMESQ